MPISAGHPQTAEAAALILKDGGNAFDAAIAALFASCVTEPCMNSIGAGGFATIRTADKQSRVFDFFCQTPKSKKLRSKVNFYPITVDFGGTKENFHIGKGSSGVPGMIAGIYELHELFGTIPMKTLVQPAIDIAKKGAIVTDFLRLDLEILEAILRIDPISKSLYLNPNDTLIKENELLFMPNFADFIYVLAREGKDLFYKGEVAQNIVNDYQADGGYLTMDDFASFDVIQRKPLKFPYRNRTILTNPLPSIGGSILALGLAEMQKTKIDFPPTSGEQVNLLHRALAKVDQQSKHLGDLGEALKQVFPNISIPMTGSTKRGNTTHFNIVDRWGNAISVTTSNGEGNGHIIPNTDNMMNNMLGEASLLPNGFHSWTPDTRLSSMMSPTLVLDEHKNLEFVLGTGGASRIPTAILQVLHYLIDHKLPVDMAVHLPRLHVGHGSLYLEPNFAKGLDVSGFKEDIVPFAKPSLFFGGVHTIALKKDGFELMGDPRRSGVVSE